MSRHDITSNPSGLYRYCSAKGNCCQQWRDKMVEKLWSRKYHWPKETRCQRGVVVWNLGGCVLFCLFRLPLLPKKTTELSIVYGIITVATGAASHFVLPSVGWMMNDGWWMMVPTLQGYTGWGGTGYTSQLHVAHTHTHTSSAWCSKEDIQRQARTYVSIYNIIIHVESTNSKTKNCNINDPSMAMNRHLRPSHEQFYCNKLSRQRLQLQPPLHPL